MHTKWKAFVQYCKKIKTFNIYSDFGNFQVALSWMRISQDLWKFYIMILILIWEIGNEIVRSYIEEAPATERCNRAIQARHFNCINGS